MGTAQESDSNIVFWNSRFQIMGSEEMKVIERAFDKPVIIEASEVKIADYSTRVYIVVLQDKVSMKTVQVIDDEVEIIHEMSK